MQLLHTPAARLVPRPRDGGASRLMCSAATGVASLVVSVLKPLGAGYAITCAIAFLAQRKLQYFPSAERPALPASLGRVFADVQEVQFVAEDGTRCLGWHWPAPPADDRKPQPPWWLSDGGSKQRLVGVMSELRRNSLSDVDVLMFHGNAGDRSHRLGWMHLVREGLGCSVTILDYRGYGGSEGSPTEQGFLQDGAAAASWLRRRQQQAAAAGGGPPRRLVLWGESIGSGVAVAIAPDAAVAPDALVLEGGFSSAVDIGVSAYPWLPVRLFMRDKFESAQRAARLPSSLPVLMVHGAQDEIAPIALGRRLFEALPARGRRFVEFAEAGHNDLPYHDSVAYLRAVGEFLRECNAGDDGVEAAK